ncbi:galactose-specific lectin nattectin-like [Corythoichthys intestinalis]|uniref:galactose-specific lectin nattectin-like n=1 Tax=Corythoichthys intestinalis TaxID=161448 RepID=UPI0025A5CA24|nr:galactose-specific lectin nattectin-like [Corythoichthys intestinalis]
MAFAVRSFFLLCAISGLLTGVWSLPKKSQKNNDCPKGWTRLDCNCYIYQGEIRALADAESVCNILGGNVASIHSDLENAFIHELVQAGGDEGYAVLGLHDTIEDDDYIWTDGSENDYTNFDMSAGEPDGSGDCVEMDISDGLWENVACDTERAYVCISEVLTYTH